MFLAEGAGAPVLLGLTLGQLISSVVVGALIAGLATVGQTILTKKLRSPADRTAAEQAANDLILKLLDRANAEIARYQELIGRLSDDAEGAKAARELVGELNRNLERVTNERDRLSIAIDYLRDKARRTGQITYAEIVVWARNALDPSVELTVFNHGQI